MYTLIYIRHFPTYHGEFALKNIDEISHLSTTMGDLLWQQITQFVDFMSNAHAELKSPEKLVYVIGIINQLKVKFPVWKSHNYRH